MSHPTLISKLMKFVKLSAKIEKYQNNNNIVTKFIYMYIKQKQQIISLSSPTIYLFLYFCFIQEEGRVIAPVMFDIVKMRVLSLK